MVSGQAEKMGFPNYQFPVGTRRFSSSDVKILSLQVLQG